MKKDFFDVNTIFKSDTYYTFNEKSMHIYMCDTKKTTLKEYYKITTDIEEDRILYTAFILYGLKNVTLDFNGATIILHGRIQPFLIDECSNITIKNAIIEYERSFFTELEVVSNSGSELCTKIKPLFPCRVENGYFIPYAKEWEDRTLHIEKCHFMQAFDSVTGDGKGLLVMYIGEEIVEQATPPCDNIQHIKVRSDGDYIIFKGNFPKSWDDTVSIVIAHEVRDKSSVSVYHSKNISIENYRIINGAGMGIYAVYTDNIKLHKFELFHDEKSHGIVSNAADGVHLISCKGIIEITDSIFEGMVDDSFNAHSNYYHTVRCEKNIIYARRSSISHGASAYNEVFSAGDIIAVYRGRTLERKNCFTVQDVKITGEWSIELTVDKATDELYEEDIIENLSTNPQIVLRNDHFGKANSHLRIQTRGKSIIENCEFGLPLMLTGDMNYWFESSPVDDLTVKNCKFYGERGVIKICPEFTATIDAPYYHSGITVSDCTFENKNALSAICTENIILNNNNTFSGKDIAVETTDCGSVTVK